MSAGTYTLTLTEDQYALVTKPTANTWSESNSASLHQTQGASDHRALQVDEDRHRSLGILSGSALKPSRSSRSRGGAWRPSSRVASSGRSCRCLLGQIRSRKVRADSGSVMSGWSLPLKTAPYSAARCTSKAAWLAYSS